MTAVKQVAICFSTFLNFASLVFKWMGDLSQEVSGLVCEVCQPSPPNATVGVVWSLTFSPCAGFPMKHMDNFLNFLHLLYVYFAFYCVCHFYIFFVLLITNPLINIQLKA